MDRLMETMYIISIDQSTSATKAVLFDSSGCILCREDLPHKQYYPHPGWVEQDGKTILNNTVSVIKKVFNNNNLSDGQVRFLSITNQTETFLLWDKKTGEPVTPVISWQDSRSSALVDSMSDYSDLFKERTGIPLSPYYSAAKLRQLLNDMPDIERRVSSGEVLFGTIECFLVWHLTGGLHRSDYCNASRTQLVNIHTLDWDQELLDIFHFPRSIFPTLLSCDADFGIIQYPGLPAIPIRGVVGDSPAALFGQLGFNEGDMKVTYGTGSSVLMNLGNNYAEIGHGITTTLGWVLSGKPTYVCEGSILYSAATIKWLEQDLELIQSAKETEEIAYSVPDTNGVYFVPAFTGMGSPWWVDDARAAIVGMNRGTKKAHVVRAALESIAYQVKDCVEVIQKNSKVSSGEIFADGGASKNTFLMQFQSDLLDQKITCSNIEESSALGAAFIGGLSIGLYNHVSDLKSLGRKSYSYTPMMTMDIRKKLYAGWLSAVKDVCRL